ncbi:hypothetical protein BH11CYA1_BH11CYA1_38070 [soil metagenome]
MSSSELDSKKDSKKGRVGKVMIVGAGVSGLVCAQQLSEAGFSVHVLDKGRRPGGRLASRERQPQFDYGAQYFTVTDHSFDQKLSAWLSEGIVQPWLGRFAIAEKERSGDCFSFSPSTPRKQRYVGVPEMNSVGLALSRELPQSATLTVEHRVTKVEIDKTGCFRIRGEKTAEDSISFVFEGFDYLVLNLPPFQIAALVATSSDFAARVQSSSSFESINEVELSPCFALMLQFAKPLAIEFDGIKASNSLLAWVARDSSKPGRLGENWLLHASPEWSRLHLEDSLEDVSAAMLAELVLVNQQELPAVTYSKCHRWRYALPQRPLAIGSLLDTENKIGYCGDWCQGNNIEAAFLSGRHMASLIVGDAS